MKTRMDVIERSIALLRTAYSRSSRLSTRDCMEITGLQQRSAQRYLVELEKLGYLQSDGSTPRGYKATDKAKQLFGVQG